jgi:hypothetical protein
MPIWTEERLPQRNFQGQDSQEINSSAIHGVSAQASNLWMSFALEVLEQHHVHDFGEVSFLCLLCKEGNT